MPVVMIPAREEWSSQTWAKVVRWVNASYDSGYAFEGEWLHRGYPAEVEEGDLILLGDRNDQRGLPICVRTFIVSQGQLAPAHDEHGPLEAKGRGWALQLRDRIVAFLQRQDEPYAALTSEELARELARHPYGGEAYGRVLLGAIAAGKRPLTDLVYICAEIFRADMLPNSSRWEADEEGQGQTVAVDIPRAEEWSSYAWAMIVTQTDRTRSDDHAFDGSRVPRDAVATVKEGGIILLYDRLKISKRLRKIYARVLIVSRGQLVPAHDEHGLLEAEGEDWALQLRARVAALLRRGQPQPTIPLGSLVRELARRPDGGLAYVAALQEAKAAGYPHASRCAFDLYAEMVKADPYLPSAAGRLVKKERAAESSGHNA